MPMGSKSKRYRCRRKKTSDLVVDISGTGFAGPEQHSTAIPALDPACDENKNQSLTGSLIGALMKPCCGIDTTTEITKVKKTKQNKTDKPLPVSGDQQSPPKDESLNQANSRSGDSGFSSSHLIFSEAQPSSMSEDNIGPGELSEFERAQASSCAPSNHPGVPDNLTILSPNRQTPPHYISRAISDMHRALNKAVQEERIPPIIPIRIRKPQRQLTKKQKKHQDKFTTQLIEHCINSERQAYEAKLADKQKVVKEGMDKVCRLKRMAKIDERIEEVWKEVDKKQTRREQNVATIQKYKAVIQRLQMEIKLLKEKQECKSMQYQLMCDTTRRMRGVLGEAVWRREDRRLRRRHASLGKEIEMLNAELYSRRDKVDELELALNSSSSGLGTNPTGQEVQETKSKLPTVTTPHLMRSNLEDDTDPQLSNGDKKENTMEEDPFVKYGLAPPVHERKPENTALISLFIGESAKSQPSPDECLKQFQMRSEKSDMIPTNSLEESDADSTSTESYSVDSLLESQSSSSSIEAYELTASADPTVFRDTSMYCLSSSAHAAASSCTY